ncbi:MAG: NINE protein [Bifidobacteriaceae bacterium]|jgi:TM2 domain-containing membrane protein YozV|nr:NINE protein [Bifidobacteriaceae bacterium]
MTSPITPGWYPDGQGNQRWHDGTQWTEHVQPADAAAAAQQAQAQAQPQQPQAQYAAAPAMAYAVPVVPAVGVPIVGVVGKRISKVAYILCTWLVGVFGVHRFMRGQVGLGIVYILTLGGLGIAVFVDLIISLVKLGSFPGTDEFTFVNGHWAA